MTLIPVDITNVKQTVQNDCLQVRSFLDWVNDRYQAYNQNLTTDVMNGLGISSGDQGFIVAFIGDLNRIKTLASGTVPSDADDMRYVIAGLLGVM
jgi:hypothetical protein